MCVEGGAKKVEPTNTQNIVTKKVFNFEFLSIFDFFLISETFPKTKRVYCVEQNFDKKVYFYLQSSVY